MGTYRRAIETAVNEKLATEPKLGAVLSDVIKKLCTGFYNDYLVDALFQKFGRDGGIDIYDAYAFLNIWAAIGNGDILTACIGIGEWPRKDSDMDGNNAILKTLWYPFSARFWGGTQDEDGVFEIAKPIRLTGENKITGLYKEQSFKGTFPLEVGYINPEKTFFYLSSLNLGGRLARWPYGSKDIWLFARVDGFTERKFNYKQRISQMLLPLEVVNETA